MKQTEPVSAAQLAVEFQSRGYRADVLYAADDPANAAVDTCRVWREPTDRYPASCVLAPTCVADDGWQWGDNFQFDAPASITAHDLADIVIETEGLATVQLCEWFALCDHPAVTTRPHPTLGGVPICARCDEKIERLSHA